MGYQGSLCAVVAMVSWLSLFTSLGSFESWTWKSPPAEPHLRNLSRPLATHHHSNGLSCTLARRSPRPTTLNRLKLTCENANTTCIAAPPPETTIHVHPADHALRRLLVRPPHDIANPSLQVHKRHSEYAAMESQLAKAVECGRGRGWTLESFPREVWARMGR